jgi:hypothetical protein
LKRDPVYDVFEHLEEKVNAVDNPSQMSYWYMKRLGTNITLQSKVFVTTEGTVTGYFTIAEIRYEYGEWNIIFDNWMRIKPIKLPGFRGFRYRKFEYEVLMIIK